MASDILEQHVFTAINFEGQFDTSIEKCILSARALWTYRRFARFDFRNKAHLLTASEKIFQHLQHPNIVVRVEAAQTVSALLEYPEVVDMVRPGLQNVLKVFLTIMDEIDYDELVHSLRRIVEVFSDEVAPYAKSLCMKLSDAFIRLIKS